MTETSIPDLAAGPCKEVRAWVNTGGSEGFEMACGVAYDYIEPTELATLRDGHQCIKQADAAGKAGAAGPDRWPQLQPGERVTLTVDAEVAHPYSDSRVSFSLAAHGASPHRTVLDIPVDHPQVTISRGVPADGVPADGELWTDQTGTVYVASQSDREGPLLCGAGDLRAWRTVHTGPSGPIRRLMTTELIASYR